MEPKKVTHPALNLVGIAVRTTNQAEANPTTAKIPGLWQRFFAENLSEQIPNSFNNGKIYGTYTNYESDYTGEYTLAVMQEVASLDNLPQGMLGVAVPAQNYLVFSAQGQMPDALIETWGYIWQYFADSSHGSRAYTTDFELYGSESNQVDIFIAVK